MLPPGLLVIHDARARGQHNEPELTTREQLDDPLFELRELHVVAGRDDAGLVEAAVELDDDLAVAVVVDFFELADVA